MDRWEWAAIQTSGLRKMQTDDWIAAGANFDLQVGGLLAANSSPSPKLDV
jgi:hypothetical protein